MCHYFKEYKGHNQTYKDFYILMRETIKPDETLEQALERGLREEFNVKANLIDFFRLDKKLFLSRPKVE